MPDRPALPDHSSGEGPEPPSPGHPRYQRTPDGLWCCDRCGSLIGDMTAHTGACWRPAPTPPPTGC